MSSGERRWWSQFASIPVLLVVLGLFAVWFYDYQKDETAFLRARNLRLVDAVAVHVEKSLFSIQGSMSRMAKASLDGSLKSVEPIDASPVTRLRALFRHLPYVKSIEASLPSAASGKEAPAGAAPAVQTKILSDRTPPLVELDAPITIPPRRDHPEESAAKTEQISVKVDISEILRQEIANDADGRPVFSDIVVATADGRVASQRDGTGGRWVRLPPDLIKSEDRSLDKGFQREIVGSVSDEPVRVFRQLVQLQGSEPLIVCGLVPAAQLRAAARSFPSSIQLLLVLAVVLAALACPLLRIAFSGPADPLRPRHMAVAGVAAIAVTAILTLVAVDVGLLRLGLADATDAELEGLALDVKARFLSELGRVRRALEQAPSDALTEHGLSHVRMFQDSRFKALGREYPFVDELDLVGPAPAPCTEGATGEQTECQLSKWTRHRYATPLFDVGARRYVRDLREGLAWEVPEGPLVAEHIRGYASGRKLTVVATFADGEPGPDPDPNLETLSVKALSAEMISVSAPILPIGYELAIFQANGDVLYHSVTQNSIDQNIYQELGDARPFRSMAVTVPFAAEYEGRDYRAYLTPIDGTPLRLAVLHDEVVPRTFNMRFIARTVLAGGLLFLLECLLLVVVWIRATTHVAWSWPNPARYGRLLLGFLCVGSCAGAVAIVRWVSPSATLPVSVAGIGVGVLSCWYILDGIPKSALEGSIARVGAVPLLGPASRWLLRRVNDVASPETTKLTYVGLLTASLVLLAVLPTLALSDLTYRWSLREELAGEALHLQDSWAARERTLLANYQHSNQGIADLRRDKLDDLYSSPDFNTKVGKESCAGGQAGRARATTTLLSVGDRLAGWLTSRGGASTAPLDDLTGSYASAEICTKALTALSVADSTSTRQRFITGKVKRPAPLGGWRPLGAAIPLLFGACWCAVALFRRRVDGFLDEPPGLPDGPAPTKSPAQIWQGCSPDEREVLAIVARGELIPRYYEEASARLAKAGLIRFAPLPRLVLPELERYARSAPLPVERPVHTGFHGLAWRPVFSLLLLGGAVFIYFTQGSGSLAFITALAGLIPQLEHLAALANLTPGTSQAARDSA
jgi:hypothetical protein